MKINGVRYLNEDNYKSLSIIDNTNGTNVKVSGNKGNGVLNLNAYALFQNLKGLDDNAAKKLLINYFIMSNKINEVCSSFNDYYDTQTIKIASGNRKMKAVLRDLSFVDEEYDEILNKYKNDRERFLKENEFDIYVTETTKKTSSYYCDVVNGKNICYLFLKSDNKTPVVKEEYFIEHFVEEKISEKNLPVVISKKYKNYDDACVGAEYSFSCGDFVIITDNENIFKLLAKIAKTHNQKLEDVKQLQYKIKGF